MTAHNGRPLTLRALGPRAIAGAVCAAAALGLLPATALAARKLVFQDDFSGRTLNTAKWSAYNGPGNDGHGLRRPRAITVDGRGHLVITARMVRNQLLSGGMASRLNLTYGRFVFRVKTRGDPTQTMDGVVLSWPQSDRWPIDGEEDIYETGGARRTFSSFLHWGVDDHLLEFRQHASAVQWHTMAMDWSPNAIKVYRDGRLVWTVTDPAAIPHVPHHLCIQLDALDTRSLTRPVKMYVDYVRIYQ
jgi:beta-glucanase (GH16 family)